MPESSPFRPPGILGSALAFLSLAVALLALYWWPEAKGLAGDEGHYQRTALAILRDGDWFDRQLIWPPLQALFLAAIYALFGPHLLAAQMLQLLLLAASGLLLRNLLQRLDVDARTATWAGFLLAVNPLTIAFATYLWPEILHLFLSLVLAWSLLRSRAAALATGIPALAPRQWSQALAWAALAGACLGLCLLTKSLLTAFWPFLLLPLLRRHDLGGSVLRLAAFALVCTLVMAPALYRGWQETGRPMVADSSWFNLWVGLQDQWRGDFVLDQTGQRMTEYLASADDHAGRVRFAREQAQAIIVEQGLVSTMLEQAGRQYFRLFDARSFPVAQLPGERCAGYLSRYRIEPGALASGIDLALRSWHLALLLLCAFGVAAWRDWRQPWLWLAIAFVGYQLALLGLLHVKTRFLLPMLPVLCLFAGHALARFRRSHVVAESGINAGTNWPAPRPVIAIVLAALLLTLATLGPYLDRACG